MKDKFQIFIETVIEQTCGFKPTLSIIEPYVGTVQIWIEGTPEQRSLVVGKNAANLEAFKRLLHIFARRNEAYAYMYVKPRDPLADKLDETIKSGIFIT